MVLEEAQFGSQIVQLEAGDLIVLRVRGALTDDKLLELCAFERRVSQDKKDVFVLVDLTCLQKQVLPGRERRILAEQTRSLPVRATALVTTSFHVRVIATLVWKLNNLISGRRDEQRAFFETEAAARAWLGEQRRLLQDARDRPHPLGGPPG